jgi:hypothetical protein
MKCFRHPENDAVGSCKHCAKGVCSQCVRDTGWGVACSEPCEHEVFALRSMIERNRKMYPLASKNHFRSAIWLAAMAAIFLGWGAFHGDDLFLISMGVVMLLGAGFAVYNGRRLAKL